MTDRERPRVDQRVTPTQKDRTKQSYDFKGERGDLKPYVMWEPGQDPDVPPELLGVLIPYGPDTRVGYLVWVDPAEMALDTTVEIVGR